MLPVGDDCQRLVLRQGFPFFKATGLWFESVCRRPHAAPVKPDRAALSSLQACRTHCAAGRRQKRCSRAFQQCSGGPASIAAARGAGFPRRRPPHLVVKDVGELHVHLPRLHTGAKAPFKCFAARTWRNISEEVASHHARLITSAAVCLGRVVAVLGSCPGASLEC